MSLKLDTSLSHRRRDCGRCVQEMDRTALKQFLLQYPGLIQSTENTSEITGNVKIQGKWYRLYMVCPYFPSTQSFKLTVASGLTVVRFSSNHFDSDRTINLVLEQLPVFVDSHLKPEDNYDTRVYDTQREILQLDSPSYKIHTNSQCSVLRFSDFVCFKEHFLQLQLNSKGKITLSEHSLPDGVQWEELFRTSNSIQTYLTQFLKFLEELREFYTNLADIDELCYVVQPLTPTSKDSWRILKLKDRVFVKLILDPFTSSPASVNVIGPTYEVESLRHTLSEGLKNWDTDMDVHANLLRTFELTYFPMANEGTQQFCNICYCYQLEVHVPVVSCDNRNCSLVYHAMCLKEWFATLTDGKVFLYVTFGVCPFCKEKLSTSFEDILR